MNEIDPSLESLKKQVFDRFDKATQDYVKFDVQ